MKSRKAALLRPLFLSVFLICAIGVLPVQQAQAFDVYHITGLGNPSSWGFGVNEAGKVAGSIGTEGFIWDEVSGMTLIGALPGSSSASTGKAINGLGQIAGYNTNPENALLWEPGGGPISLSTTGRANDINESSQIVGWYYPPGAKEAFIWDSANGLVGIGDLPGGIFESWALAINDFGQVTGSSVYESREDPYMPEMFTYVEQAFTWDDVNGMVGLEFLPGHDTSRGDDINNSGQVVGYTSSVDFGGPQAVLWDPAMGLISLGQIPGGNGSSHANSINNRGDVLGLCTPPGSSYRPFLWNETEGMVLLQSLLDSSGTGWELLGAYDINDSGQIVGHAYNPSGSIEAYILNPVICLDNDTDNYTNCEGDCNDDDGAINPGATEIIYNGVDENCNGMSDDDDLDQDWYFIVDDCNDNDGAINPGATEIPYNGADENCNGMADDDDLDQDGYLLVDDCNDVNAAFNPGACDIKNDGIDQDCNGSDRKKGKPCDGGSTCNPTPGEEFVELTCTDGTDNDCDGMTDGDDSDCVTTDEICDDGIDNDGDGKTDCDDKKDCNKDPAC